MASLWDYISPTGEGSQARSNWLRENVDQPISEAARYYLGAGTGVPNLLGLLADGTPSSGLGRASQASQQLFAPDQSIMDRITSTGNLLSETAGVGAGLLGVNQTARAVGPAVEDATRAVGRNIAERLNQRGPMPTLGSNGGNMFDVVRKDAPSISDTIRAKYPDVEIDLFGDPNKGYELSKIVIPKGERNSGSGTQVMEDIVQMADAQGAKVSLTPDVAFGGTSVSRLKDFYKRFGFVENKGKNKDFSTRNTMYRNPKDVEALPAARTDVVGQVSPVPALSKADQMRREANIQRFGYDPSEVPVEPTGILAYHGTPHSFDKFDTSKIGTGEGAQAYGHGLYFAENEGVARGYRDALSKQVTLDGKPMLSHPSDGPVGQAENSIARAVSNGEDPASAISREAKEWRDAAQAYRDAGVGQTSDVARSAEQTARSFEDVANAIEAQDPNRFIKNTGSMYEVKINADPKDFLNWDLPISQQPKAVQDIVRNSDLTHLPEHGRLRRTIEAWRKNKGDWVPEGGANIPEPSGNDIYNALTDFGTDPTRNVNFSNELNNSGVKGIKYLDEGSRGKGYEVKLGIKGKPYETEPQYARSKEEAENFYKIEVLKL
jgi:GNAT superfamily N-acetyltransferase